MAKKTTILSLVLFLVVVLGVCACNNNSSNHNSNTITISVDTGATNQFIRAFTGADVNVTAQPLFFEELYDYKVDGSQVPRLAKSAPVISYKPFTKQELSLYYKNLKEDVAKRVKDGEFKDKAMQDAYIKTKKKYVSKGVEFQTIKLKEGITWNDGVPFTAKDVAFTFYNGWVGYCNDLWNCYMHNPPKVIDDHTIQFSYNHIALDQAYDLTIRPEHILEKEVPKKQAYNGTTKRIVKNLYDIGKWQAKDPIGTGPGKLISFSPGKIKIGWRSDYWGGNTNGIKEIDFVPAGSPAKAQADITKGASDWAQGYVNDVQTVFINKSQDNHYQYFPNGNSRAIKFNTKLAPVNDVAVRKALINSVGLTTAQKAVNIGYGIPSITGVSVESRWVNWIAPEYRTALKPNIAKAKKYLKDAGWSINSNGNLEKGGKEYPLTLHTSTTERAEDLIIMPIIKKEWEDNLGLVAKYTPQSDTPFQAAKNALKYQAWTDNATSIDPTRTEPFNDFAWEVTALGWNLTQLNISTAGNNAIDDIRMIPRENMDKIIKLNQVASKAIVEGAPYLPYQDLGMGVMWSTKHWTNWPTLESKNWPLISKDAGGDFNFVDVLKQLKKV